MPRYAAAMNGTGPYEVVIYTSTVGTQVTVQLYWQRTGSVGYSSYNGGASFNVTIGGVSVASGSYNFSAPAGGPIGEQWIGGGVRDVGAIGAVWCAGYFNTDTSGAGYGEVGGAQSVATVPGAPINNAGTPDQITTRGMRYQFTGNGDGGSGIIRWEYECWPTGGAPTGVGTSTGTTIRNDLLPGTEWNWHSRGVNAVGAGPWSAVAKGTTLAASASTLNVAASLQGTSATLTPVLSSTMPAVGTWLVERRLQGTTTATSYSFTTSSYTATGLTQGAIYEWRVAARLAQNGVTYTSPWSNWAATQQPNPNTNPGTYFDGASAATGDATFSWSGTQNNSISNANGKDVRGWAIVNNDGLAVLYRQIGGRSGGYAARILCTADASGPNALIFASNSENWTEIAVGGMYTASFYVQVPKRAQCMAAYIIWRDALTAPIGSPVVGSPVVVGPNPGLWTRVMVTAQAPAGAVYADIQLYDVAGTGFSPWQGGDYWIVDDAMIALAPYSYFDGNTPDDTSFTYDWVGEPNASASTATPVLGLEVDPLADPDCPPPPLAPPPPQISDACIDDITTWRRYWAIVPKDLISKWIAQVPTITLTSGTQATRQARIRFYENPDQLTPDQFTDIDNWSSEQVVTYIPAGGVFTIDGVSERARAQVGTSGALPADHLLLGTGGTPVSWPLLRCNMGYLMSVDVPLDAPIGNLQVGVSLTARM